MNMQGEIFEANFWVALLRNENGGWTKEPAEGVEAGSTNKNLRENAPFLAKPHEKLLVAVQAASNQNSLSENTCIFAHSNKGNDDQDEGSLLTATDFRLVFLRLGFPSSSSESLEFSSALGGWYLPPSAAALFRALLFFFGCETTSGSCAGDEVTITTSSVALASDRGEGKEVEASAADEVLFAVDRGFKLSALAFFLGFAAEMDTDSSAPCSACLVFMTFFLFPLPTAAAFPDRISASRSSSYIS